MTHRPLPAHLPNRSVDACWGPLINSCTMSGVLGPGGVHPRPRRPVCGHPGPAAGRGERPAGGGAGHPGRAPGAGRGRGPDRLSGLREAPAAQGHPHHRGAQPVRCAAATQPALVALRLPRPPPPAPSGRWPPCCPSAPHRSWPTCRPASPSSSPTACPPRCWASCCRSGPTRRIQRKNNDCGSSSTMRFPIRRTSALLYLVGKALVIDPSRWLSVRNGQSV